MVTKAIRWQIVCSRCGKSGAETLQREDRRPNGTPNMGGKCPSSADGKHKPKWVKLGPAY
ncbi:MAG: hypothetical protein Q4F00_12730 [bacterium]|nr:hypothetical protein [bacterium]